MPRNGSGVFSLAGTDFPAVGGTVIDPAKHNANFTDVATAITASIAVDGQSVVTQDIPMSGKKFTGVGDGTSRTHSASLGQVQDDRLNWVVATGTADAITATFSPAITALVDGQTVRVRALAANTGAVTFSPNGLTARPVTNIGGAALTAGRIYAAAQELILVYNLAGLRWELTNPVYGLVATAATANTLVMRGAAGEITGAAGNFTTLSATGNVNLKTTVALADAAATLTAAQLVGSGIFTITPTVARILTTDTAANIVAALPGYQVGTWFDFTIVNLAAFDVTLAAGTGITLVGKMITHNASGTFKARIDSATAVTISSGAVASVAGSATQAFTATTAAAGTDTTQVATTAYATALGLTKALLAGSATQAFTASSLKVGAEAMPAWPATWRVVDLGNVTAFFERGDGVTGIASNASRNVGDTAWIARVTGPASVQQLEVNGGVRTYTAPSVAAGAVLTFTERMSVANDGAVTVGGNAVRHNGNIFHGRVNADGTAGRLPAGWTSARLALGEYAITHGLNTLLYSLGVTSRHSSLAHICHGFTSGVNASLFYTLSDAGAKSDSPLHFTLLLD